ncbi:MAG: RNA polymerase sigma factor [Bacillota bacterium]
MVAEDLMIAERASLGDERAFEEIYSTYYKQILWHVTRMVGDRMDAEDITQDVFLKAYQFIGSYSGTASLGRWLRKIATNTCIDRMRKRTIATAAWPMLQSKDGDEQPLEFPDDSPSPLDVTEARESERAILQEIDRLPEYYKKVVYLHDVLGKSGEETAREAACPIGTVKSRLSRAHGILRTAFEAPTYVMSRAGA